MASVLGWRTAANAVGGAGTASGAQAPPPLSMATSASASCSGGPLGHAGLGSSGAGADAGDEDARVASRAVRSRTASCCTCAKRWSIAAHAADSSAASEVDALRLRASFRAARCSRLSACRR